MRSGFVLTATVAIVAVATSRPSYCATPADEKYKATELKEAPPQELEGPVRESLGKTGYRVTDAAGKTICDVWLRVQLPVLDKFEPLNDLVYPIAPGTLVGAIRFPDATADYRKQSIKGGTYTLRYGHQPQDGNHIGTAQYRDFTLAIPAAHDKTLAGVDQEKATNLSKKATGSTHPAIFCLLPPQRREKYPVMAHDDTLDLEVLVAKTSAKPGGTKNEVQIELVTVGHAPE